MRKMIFLIALLSLATAPAVMAEKELSWKNLMLASAKLSDNFDYEARVDGYMKKFRHSVYEQYHEDEFEMQSKREETIRIMKKEVAEYDLKEVFVINTTREFEEYDFEKNLFPLESFSRNVYFKATRHVDDYPFAYKLTFKNPGLIGDLKMPKDKAKSFVDARKDRDGNVWRSVPIRIKVKAVGSGKGLEWIEGKIVSATVYKSKEMTDPIATFSAGQ